MSRARGGLRFTALSRLHLVATAAPVPPLEHEDLNIHVDT
jgi:hypothetical protein